MKRTRFLLMLTLVTTALVPHGESRAAAIVRTDWFSGGDSAIYSNAIAGNEVAVPLVAKGYGGQSSLVSIQNTDALRSRTASVAFYKPG